MIFIFMGNMGETWNGECTTEEGHLINYFSAVISGDTTGDGEINAVDALAIVKHKLGKYTIDQDKKIRVK